VADTARGCFAARLNSTRRAIRIPWKELDAITPARRIIRNTNSGLEDLPIRVGKIMQDNPLTAAIDLLRPVSLTKVVEAVASQHGSHPRLRGNFFLEEDAVIVRRNRRPDRCRQATGTGGVSDRLANHFRIYGGATAMARNVVSVDRKYYRRRAQTAYCKKTSVESCVVRHALNLANYIGLACSAPEKLEGHPTLSYTDIVVHKLMQNG
jgi:hypothetical protein